MPVLYALLLLASDRPQLVLQGHQARVVALAFSPDGKMLASGSDDATIKLWDVTTGKERATLKGHVGGICSVAFSPDGGTLASVGTIFAPLDAPPPWPHKGELIVWDLPAGKKRVQLGNPDGPLYCLAWSPDGKALAVGW